MTNRFFFFCFIQCRNSSKVKSRCPQAVFLLALRVQRSEARGNCFCSDCEDMTVISRNGWPHRVYAPFVEGEINGEEIPLQHPYISTLFSQRRFWWSWGKKKRKAPFCVAYPCVSSCWEARQTVHALLSCMCCQTASLSEAPEALLLSCNCWQVQKVQLKALTHWTSGLWAPNSLQLSFCEGSFT